MKNEYAKDPMGLINFSSKPGEEHEIPGFLGNASILLMVQKSEGQPPFGCKKNM